MKINEVIKKDINNIVWYHGSKNKFDFFSPEFADKEEAFMKEGPGYYLTTDEKDALTYGPNILKFRVNVKKLVSLTKPPKPVIVQALIKNSPKLKFNLENWGENPAQAFREAFSVMMQRGSEKEVFEQVWYDFYKDDAVKWMNNLVSFGYTGLLIPRVDLYHFILYDLTALTKV